MISLSSSLLREGRIQATSQQTTPRTTAPAAPSAQSVATTSSSSSSLRRTFDASSIVSQRVIDLSEESSDSSSSSDSSRESSPDQEAMLRSAFARRHEEVEDEDSESASLCFDRNDFADEELKAIIENIIEQNPSIISQKESIIRLKSLIDTNFERLLEMLESSPVDETDSEIIKRSNLKAEKDIKTLKLQELKLRKMKENLRSLYLEKFQTSDDKKDDLQMFFGHLYSLHKT